MFDRPYCGCTCDLTTYDRVLLLVGGRGETFALGMPDALVGVENDVKTRCNHRVLLYSCTLLLAQLTEHPWPINWRGISKATPLLLTYLVVHFGLGYET